MELVKTIHKPIRADTVAAGVADAAKSFELAIPSATAFGVSSFGSSAFPALA